MPRPTTMTGWYYVVFTKRARSSVAFMANFLGISPRTLNRIANGQHEKPLPDTIERFKELAGPELCAHEKAPKWIKPPKKAKK